MCAGWPNEARNPPHPLPPDGSYPNVMVANPTYFPPTPLINAVSVWLQLPQARLLIADSDGHQSLIVSRCAFEAELGFLLDTASAQPVTIPRLNWSRDDGRRAALTATIAREREICGTMVFTDC